MQFVTTFGHSVYIFFYLFKISGINAVVRSLDLKEGDAVLINIYTYPAVKNLCQYLAKIRGNLLTSHIVHNFTQLNFGYDELFLLQFI